MSEQFTYVHLNFVPKVATLKVAILPQCEVVVEIPKHLVQFKLSEFENLGEEAIALDLARKAALATFPAQMPGLYDQEEPTWQDYRPHVMNERACDHQENGIRAWKMFRNSDVRNS